MKPCVACGTSTRGTLDLRLTIEAFDGPDVDTNLEVAICTRCAARIGDGENVPGRLVDEDHP